MSSHEIPLSSPDVGELEEQLVLRVLRSGRLSIGPMLEEFEHLVAERAGCSHSVAVSSGTSGLHASLAALGIGPGDEVITTPFSFIASANVILMVGATPVFVDICPTTLNMDPSRIEAAITPRTAAILGVEAFGNCAHMGEYARIAARHEIPLVEDCCEALGCRSGGRKAGSFGRVGVFGFYPNKQITTGEGGMIVTDDANLADVCRSLRNQGRRVAANLTTKDPQPMNTGSWLAHERLGFNYRMSEVSAAIGVAQMRRFDEIVARRQKVASLYMDRLMGIPDLVLPTVAPGDETSWFVYVVRLAAGYGREERDRIIRGLRNHEIGCADYFPCIHLQPFYRDMFGYEPGRFPVAESVSQRTIALPFHARMGEREVDLVAQTLELMLRREDLNRP
ncbi:MAG: DegT/DnrJ/EryC1/StrS family aminotransferase [Phycisphaerales bacterium]